MVTEEELCGVCGRIGRDYQLGPHVGYQVQARMVHKHISIIYGRKSVPRLVEEADISSATEVPKTI